MNHPTFVGVAQFGLLSCFRTFNLNVTWCLQFIAAPSNRAEGNRSGHWPSSVLSFQLCVLMSFHWKFRIAFWYTFTWNKMIKGKQHIAGKEWICTENFTTEKRGPRREESKSDIHSSSSSSTNHTGKIVQFFGAVETCQHISTSMCTLHFIIVHTCFFFLLV